MSKLRNLLALSWLGTLIALLFSNLGDRLALTLLLSQTPALPLGLWLVLASLAGALTTLALALLNRRSARPAASPDGEPHPRRRRRPWKRSPEDEWTFMGVDDSEESWDSWPESDAPRNRESADTGSEVIDTSFRVLRPAAPQEPPPREPRRPEPAQPRPTPSPAPAPGGDDWDFVERDDW